ncbi:hypothetical protein ACFV0Z_24365 [Streptomyces xiamenensis]|uniref:hypothetical protein n=1 Tax=Streptomyces xiamenensis TaxID=408015 RepID=UPI0036AF6633
MTASVGGLVWAVQHRNEAERALRAAGGSPRPAGLPAEPIDATLAWRAPSPDLSSFSERVDRGGLWLHDNAVVRVTPEALMSHGLATGEELWCVPLAAGVNGRLYSHRIDSDRIAVLSGMNCEHLLVIDVVTGEEHASFPLETARLAQPHAGLAILGDKVVVSSIAGSLGFRGGQELWRWTFDVETEGSRMEISGVISIDPLVVFAELDGSLHTSRIYVVEDTRESILREVSYDFTDRHHAPCESSHIWWCNRAVADGDYLALTARGAVGLSIVDLSTGDLVGDVSANGRGNHPVAVVEGEILAYRPGTEALAGTVVAIDPETLLERMVMALDATAAAMEHDLWSSEINHVRMFWYIESHTFVMARGDYAPSREQQPDSALLSYR